MKKILLCLMVVLVVFATSDSYAQAFVNQYARKLIMADGSTTPVLLTLKAPTTISSPYSLTFPTTLPLASAYLTTDNTGALSWTLASSVLSGVTADAPLSGAGTSASHLVIAQATTSTSGYLSSTDWNIFFNKGNGTVTAVSVASANGFAGSSSGGATPALTLSTTISGILKGNGTAISSATVGTDYSVGTSSLATGILKSTTATGALSIATGADLPTHTHSAADITSGTLIIARGGTNSTTTLSGTARPVVTTATAIVENNATISNNTIAKWSGSNFANSSLSDDGTNVSTNENILLSTASKQLSFQGTGTGVTTFQAGAQTTNTYNYTLPITTPTANQVLTATAVGGASPFAVTLGWATPTAALSGLTTNGAIYAASATSVASTSAMTNGQLLIGSTGVAPVLGTLTGTANRLAITNGAGSITLNIDPAYVGQNTITTLGTIGTGTWNATAIGATVGGTGQTTYATGDILYASAANTLSKRTIGSTNDVLTVVGGVPVWQAPISAGVNYNVTSTQSSATVGASNYLFDVSYGATAAAQNALGARIVSTNTSTTTNRNATALTLNATATTGGTATGLVINTSGGSAQPHISLTGATSGIITSPLAEVYYEETGDTYGTARLHLQHRTGSNGALFETISNGANPNTDLVDFAFKPGNGVQSNIRLEARTAYLRGTSNTTSSTYKEEFQYLFGTTQTTPLYVMTIGPEATLLESGNFGIGYSASYNTFPVASPLEKLDVHTTSSLAGNILLSNYGTSSSSGTAGLLKFQGTRDGITSFAAGAQASTFINYVLPTAQPSANQVLTAAAPTGAGTSASPYAVALSWANASGSLSGGVSNTITKWTGATTVGLSGLIDNGSSLKLGTQGTGATTPTSYTFGSAGWTAASTSNNQAGTNLTIQGGPGTGNNTTAGDVVIQTPVTGSSGTTVQTLSDRMRIMGNFDQIKLGAGGSGSTAPSTNFMINAIGWTAASTSNNQAGTDLIISGGASTGSGSSNIIFNTATAGTSGTTVRTATEAMRITGNSIDLSPYGTAAGNTTELHFKELTANGSNYTALKAADAMAANVTYTLPTTAPTSGGQFLSSTTGGTMSWQAQQVVWSGHIVSGTLNTGATEYACLSGVSSAGATEADFAILVPFDCTITGIYVEIENAPGTGNSWAFNVRQRNSGGSTDGTAVSISGNAATTANGSFTLSCSAGDRIVLRSVPASNPAAPGNVFFGVSATIP